MLDATLVQKVHKLRNIFYLHASREQDVFTSLLFPIPVLGTRIYREDQLKCYRVEKSEEFCDVAP